MNPQVVREIAVSPNGHLAAAVGLGPEVFVWDVAGRRETQNAFFGVEWSYRHSGDKTLIRIDSESGETNEACNLGPGLAAEFCLSGDAVLKSDCDVVDVASGASIGAIALRHQETAG